MTNRLVEVITSVQRRCRWSRGDNERIVAAVDRIDALFAVEREINMTPQERQRVRNERGRPLVVALETWLREQRAKLSSKNETAKAIHYRSTTSIRRLGSPTSWPDCPTIRPSAFTNCCPGIGDHKISQPKLLDQEAGSPGAGLPRGPHRTRTQREEA